jgi:hypothetical protein
VTCSAVSFTSTTELHERPLRTLQDPPGVQFDEEQHLQPLQPEGVDGEEVAGDDLCGLLAKGRAPGCARRPRGRVEPAAAECGADRGCGDALAEELEFSLDALVAQRGSP